MSSSNQNKSTNNSRVFKIRKHLEGYVYLDIQLLFYDKSAVNFNEIDESVLKSLVEDSVTMFGNNGFKFYYDLLKFRQEDLRAYIRVDKRYYVQCHLGLTRELKWKDFPCRLILHKVCLTPSSLPLGSSIADNIIEPDK